MILRKNACITSSPFHLSTFSPFSDCSAYAEHAEDGGGYGCDDFQDYRCCLFSFVAHWFWFFCFGFGGGLGELGGLGGLGLWEGLGIVG